MHGQSDHVSQQNSDSSSPAAHLLLRFVALPAGLMTETQVYELMKQQSGGLLQTDRFGFIRREDDEVS